MCGSYAPITSALPASSSKNSQYLYSQTMFVLILGVVSTVSYNVITF